MAINCGGLPEQLFESEIFGHELGAFTGANKRRIGKVEWANGGTMFLDEIESLPMSLQVKLLRVLQERKVERLGSNELIPVDCRVIAASQEDLGELVKQQRFRSDLYYRLNVAVIELPPLRERREDIPILFEHFVLDAATRYGREAPIVSGAQLSELMAYSWPGNVRELHNVADRFVLGLLEARFKLLKEVATARANAVRPGGAIRTGIDRGSAAPASGQRGGGERSARAAEEDVLRQAAPSQSRGRGLPLTCTRAAPDRTVCARDRGRARGEVHRALASSGASGSRVRRARTSAPSVWQRESIRRNPLHPGKEQRMLPDLDLVNVSRLQFAATAMYHFLFVPLTLGLVVDPRHLRWVVRAWRTLGLAGD